MKVEINIDETEFKELLDGQLSKLSDETIQNIILESIKEYFAKNDYKNVEDLFLQVDKNQYGYTSKSANPFFEGLIRDCDYSKLQDLLDKTIDALINNHEEIIKSVFLEAISDKIANTYSFRDYIQAAMINRSLK